MAMIVSVLKNGTLVAALLFGIPAFGEKGGAGDQAVQPNCVLCAAFWLILRRFEPWFQVFPVLRVAAAQLWATVTSGTKRFIGFSCCAYAWTAYNGQILIRLDWLENVAHSLFRKEDFISSPLSVGKTAPGRACSLRPGLLSGDRSKLVGPYYLEWKKRASGKRRIRKPGRHAR